MSKNKRVFENSAVIILMMICMGLIVVILQIIIGGEEIHKEHIAEDISGLEMIGNIIVDIQEDVTDKAGETAPEVIIGEIYNEESYVGENNTEEAITQVNGTNVTEGSQAEEVPEVYEFTASDVSYFDDALFIGDSRTVGLREFGSLDNADYFASTGLNLYKIENAKTTYGEHEHITLEKMLQQNTYGKIYVMLGINELGYHFDVTVERYRAFIEYLMEKQPGAIVYVCANLHVNHLRNKVDEIHNNAAINRINQTISEMADQKNIFYLDANPLFDDENGNLSDEFTSDDSHLKVQYYQTWCEWYGQNTIVKE